MTPDALAQLDAARRDHPSDASSATARRRDRFGLTHADLRIANLLVDGDRTIVIDFDDCGLAWFMYDWATAVSFMEDHPQVPELQAAWVEGYRSVAPLSAEDEAELATFVMLRRLLLVAWIGSHHTFATEAAELGAGFTAGTCELAETYLADHSPRPEARSPAACSPRSRVVPSSSPAARRASARASRGSSPAPAPTS